MQISVDLFFNTESHLHTRLSTPRRMQRQTLEFGIKSLKVIEKKAIYLVLFLLPTTCCVSFQI